MTLLLPSTSQSLVTFHGTKHGLLVNRKRAFLMLIKKAAIGAVLVALSVTFGGGITTAKEKSTVVRSTAGSASWYGGQFHGRKTANGERFNMNGLTAAHRSLPFGTKVRSPTRRTASPSWSASTTEAPSLASA
jgi:rare lipoprotein A (peptidoglycan hydrolase)